MIAPFARLLAVFTLISCLPLFADDPAGAADAGKTHLLRYTFHEGEIVGYKVDHQTRVIVQQQEAEQHVEHGAVTNKRYTVRKVDEEGNAVLDLQIDRVRMTAAVDGGESVDYDTASGEAPPSAFQGIDATVGKPHVRVKVSPRGELLSLDWLIAANQQMKPTIENASELDIMVLLPEKAIKVGDTWKEAFDVEIHAAAGLKKSIKIQREYTLEGVDGNQATIALKTVVLTPLHDPAQEVQLVSKTPRGTVTFDLGRGVVTARTQHVDKAIVGFAGEKSKSRTVSERTEELAPIQVSLEAKSDTVTR
jgi:hypothetical protein